MARSQVLLLAGARGWHEARLAEAMASVGFDVVRGALSDIDLTSQSATGFVGLCLEDRLPDAVFVRGIAPGTFQEITRRLDVLHALEMAGVLVVNAARIIERTVDKGMTSHLLARANVPTPPAWTTETRETALSIVRQEIEKDETVVIKPLFGSQGKGLGLIKSVTDVPDVSNVDGVWYLQRFIDRPGDWIDWRVFICRSRVVARMMRRGQNWITNRAQGGHCEPSVDDDDILETALAAAAALDVWYAGVDLVRDRDNRATVLEVNGVPAWQGVESVSDTDIALHLAQQLKASLTGEDP